MWVLINRVTPMAPFDLFRVSCGVLPRIICDRGYHLSVATSTCEGIFSPTLIPVQSDQVLASATSATIMLNALLQER